MLLGRFNFDSRCFPCVLLFLVSLGSFLTAFIGDAPFSPLLLVLRFVPVLWHWLVNLSDLKRDACRRNRCNEHPMIICVLISLSMLANSQVWAHTHRVVLGVYEMHQYFRRVVVLLDKISSTAVPA